MDSTGIIPSVPESSWLIVYAYLNISDLISLSKAVPCLRSSIDKARKWGMLFEQEFGPYASDKPVDFTYFSDNWKTLYSMDTKGRLAEMIRTKLDRPVETVTECMIQDTGNLLYLSSNVSNTKSKTPPISGGCGATWYGREIWIRDAQYLMHNCVVDFDITYASQQGNHIYFYLPSIGITKANMPPSTARKTPIKLKELQEVCTPKEPVKKFIHTKAYGIMYLGDSGSIYDINGLVHEGIFIDIIPWRKGILALTATGTILDTNHDLVSSYNDPIKQLCSALNVFFGSREKWPPLHARWEYTRTACEGCAASAWKGIVDLIRIFHANCLCHCRTIWSQAWETNAQE